MMRKTVAWAIVVFALVLLASAAGIAAAPSGTLSVSFIDVGQGDSALIRDSTGFDVLIDGGVVSAGPTVVAYLREGAVDDVDVMMVTHADADHVGGLIDVLESDIPVRSVLYNGYPGSTATWSSFVGAVVSEGLTLTVAQYPAAYTWGATTAHVLNPLPGLSSPDQNDASVVILIDSGEIELLFTGDIDTAVEAEILARGTPVAAEILKVAHHGSSYSSSNAFLAAVNPKEAVISVGDNTYGHPSEETLARLAAAGARVWRTDEVGDVVLATNGVTYTIVSPAITTALSIVYLPLVERNFPSAATPGPDLRIVALSGTTAPEYVTIQNFSSAAQTMAGWYLASEVGPQTFNFPAGYVLAAGATVRIESYTGAGNNPPSVLFWTTAAIWTNTGDKAVLYNSLGEPISSACYGTACP